MSSNSRHGLLQTSVSPLPYYSPGEGTGRVQALSPHYQIRTDLLLASGAERRGSLIHHLYLSPHFDDVPLGCAGLILRQRARGERCAIVDVFNGRPRARQPLSDFARHQHEMWGNPADPMGFRFAEERRAAERLDADLVTLGYQEAIYRGERYAREAALFGAVHTADLAVRCRLVRRLQSLLVANPGARLYSPLGAGGHVDHQLLTQAALALGAIQPVDLWLYEDTVYLIRRPGERERRLQEFGLMLQPQLVDITDQIDGKIEALSAYDSQLPVLFGSAEAMPSAIRRFHEALGGGGRAVEQYWRVTHPAPTGPESLTEPT
ncbi:MAG: PIG-L family deacetylase [Chloroflexi bacterium]|nr:PIG-L family deacetylase [Chloroflexota bacterium]